MVIEELDKIFTMLEGTRLRLSVDNTTKGSFLVFWYNEGRKARELFTYRIDPIKNCLTLERSSLTVNESLWHLPETIEEISVLQLAISLQDFELGERES